MKDRIDTLLHEESRFEPPAQRAGRSLVPDYEGLYRHSIADLEGYWERIAGEIRVVRRVLGPIAAPAELEFAAKLPKTRSGKIMRRVLKAQELGLDPGDVSTIEE